MSKLIVLEQSSLSTAPFYITMQLVVPPREAGRCHRTKGLRGPSLLEEIHYRFVFFLPVSQDRSDQPESISKVYFFKRRYGSNTKDLTFLIIVSSMNQAGCHILQEHTDHLQGAGRYRRGSVKRRHEGDPSNRVFLIVWMSEKGFDLKMLTVAESGHFSRPSSGLQYSIYGPYMLKEPTFYFLSFLFWKVEYTAPLLYHLRVPLTDFITVTMA